MVSAGIQTQKEFVSAQETCIYAKLASRDVSPVKRGDKLCFLVQLTNPRAYVNSQRMLFSCDTILIEIKDLIC